MPPDTTGRLFEDEPEDHPVECLGLTFPSDQARREHFLALLREQLADPAFRAIEGFPLGDDEAILRLSDPPYYTACPNPWLSEFVARYGKPYDAETDDYHREPYAVDTSEGKTDPLYKAHGYHTKVPYKAIIPAIVHYTEPGDIVLDGFCGSGMTGVAAQLCARPDPAYRQQVEQERQEAGLPAPVWGARRVILNDLGPAASFIAANFNLPFDVAAFADAAQRILDEVESELGWMYETTHTDGRTKGRINFTVWSEVFGCPECGGEVVFVDEALDPETKRVYDEFPCPQCGATVTKRRLVRLSETYHDTVLGRTVQGPMRRPVLINYSVGRTRHEKKPDTADLALLARVSAMAWPSGFAAARMMHAAENTERWGDNWRAGTANFTHIHHLFLPRQAQALGALWTKANAVPDARLRNMLLWLMEQAIWGMSVLNRYVPTHFSQVNQYMNGLIRLLSQHSECSPWYILDGKLGRVTKAFTEYGMAVEQAALSTGSTTSLLVPSDSVDYVFTDPPFGDNFAYAELNFLVESWHRLWTNMRSEAIISEVQRKALREYQILMRRCFAEYYRVLKPGRWMTVVFHNSRNDVWNAIQEALSAAGFVVADVRTLDKQQGSFNQIVAQLSVKQDLVISAYKPGVALEQRFALAQSDDATAWEFVENHLRQVPRFVGAANGVAEVIAERLPHVLFDRMVAFHVRHGVTVPMGAGDFLAQLRQRYLERDGMYFLSEQVEEYERRRMTVRQLQQLTLIVTDEASAIQWLRQQLTNKPQTFQELHPQFMQEIGGWSRTETALELIDLLRENYLAYEGTGQIPPPIWAWLGKSSTLREQMNGQTAETAGAALRAQAKDRWYVPDPNRAGDLDKLRERALLQEFDGYRQSREKKLRVFRLEAIRAGFKRAWQDREYRTILEVAAKLPEAVIQEDPKLLMWWDQAVTRVGE